MTEFSAKTENELDKIAEAIWANIEHKIILFKGDLGAGKTTLIKTLLKAKKTPDLVSSPSFSLINEYRFEGEVLYHLDLYRLNDIDEALNIGIEEYLDSGHWVFIEWPDLIKDLLPNEYHTIQIEILESWERKIILI